MSARRREQRPDLDGGEGFDLFPVSAADATEQGYLKNLEDRRGKPARLVPGDPLPEDLRILPATEELRRCTADANGYCNGSSGKNPIGEPFSPDRCSVADENGGRETPLPAPDENGRVEFLL